MSRQTFFIIALTCVSAVAGCNGAKAPPDPSGPGPSAPPAKTVVKVPDKASNSTAFRDVAAVAGVDAIYRNGEEAETYTILESLGGGVGILDFDRDGLDDLIFAGGGQITKNRELRGLPAFVYRNRGVWSFVQITRQAGIEAATHYNHGVIAGDYDSDGFQDFVVTGYGGLQLFYNCGDGTFEDVSSSAGLVDSLWSSSAAWGDFDGDRVLDLFVAHYVNWSFENDPACLTKGSQREVCPPRQFSGRPASLFLGNGDGTFRDGSAAASLRTDDKGLGIVAADMDLDGDLDAYITNDTIGNDVYRNDGKGRFEDHSLISGASLSDRGTPDGSMGVDICDFNLDGLPDIWVVNYENESAALYQNEGNMLFRHVSQPKGVTAAGGMHVGWGTCCFDADRDGDEDIFVSNGHVIRYPVNAPLRQKPQLFVNLGGTRFRTENENVSGYMAEPHMGRGAAAGDLDRDGDIDLAVSHTNEPVAVLSNESPRAGSWIQFELTGTVSPRDAIGTIVRIKTSLGEQTRHWKGGTSYASTSSRIIDFGVGKAEAVESVEIRWPSGIVQTVASPQLNTMHRIVEAPSPQAAETP